MTTIEEKQILKNLIKLHFDIEVTGLDSFKSTSINNVLGYLMEHHTDAMFINRDVSKGINVLASFCHDLDILKIVKQKNKLITKENLLIFLNERYGLIRNYKFTIKTYDEYFTVWTKKKIEWLYETDEINNNFGFVKDLCCEYMAMREKCRENLYRFEELQKQYEWLETATEGIPE